MDNSVYTGLVGRFKRDLQESTATGREESTSSSQEAQNVSLGSLQGLWENVPALPGLPPGTVDWIPSNNPDGLVFDMSHVEETSMILKAFCDACNMVTNPFEDTRKLANLRKSAKIVLVLSVMRDGRPYLNHFLKNGWNDDAFPFVYNDLLTIMGDSAKAKMFVAQQYRVEERPWAEGDHAICYEYEPLRLTFMSNLSTLGYYGSVDRVQDIKSDEKYARKTQKAVPGAKQHWRNEVKVLKDLSTASDKHHIVAFVKTYQRGADEFGCLIRPAADTNLHEFLRHYANVATEDKKVLGIALLRAIGCLSLSLWYLHKKVLLRHRDIKPQNILYHVIKRSKHGAVEKDEFLWADFGLSYDFKPHAVSSTRQPSGLGTEEYSAPETGLEQAHGRATDIFSFGCTILEILNVLTSKSLDEPEEQWLTRFQPYKYNIQAIRRWIDARKKSLREEDAHLARILTLTSNMIDLDPGKRPNIEGILRHLKKTADTSGKELFCTRCVPILRGELGIEDCRVPNSDVSRPNTERGRSFLNFYRKGRR